MSEFNKDVDFFGDEIQPEFDPKKLDLEKVLIMGLVAQIKQIYQITITFNKLATTEDDKKA